MATIDLARRWCLDVYRKGESVVMRCRDERDRGYEIAMPDGCVPAVIRALAQYAGLEVFIASLGGDSVSVGGSVVSDAGGGR